jgi:hypothetical protein
MATEIRKSEFFDEPALVIRNTPNQIKPIIEMDDLLV